MSDLDDSDHEDNPEELEKKPSFKEIPTKESEQEELEMDEELDDADLEELPQDDLGIEDLDLEELESSATKKIFSGNVEDTPDVEYSDMPHELADPSQITPVNSDIESEDEDYLQKIDEELHNNYAHKYHPECFTGNATEIENLTHITRDSAGIIIDENHKTNPFLTKYEQTKILGQRAKQLNYGDSPYITVPKEIIDGYLIAQLELKEKKIPVIIRRPLPGGKSEYWKLSDLELIY